MSYNNIEKITNEIYRPSSNYVLKHNVKVANKNKENKRELFHSEFSYSSNQYMDKKYLKMIRLKYMSFLTLEEQGKDWTEREVVMITNSNIHLFRKSMKRVKKWFYKDEYSDLFYYDSNKMLNINMKFKGLKEIINTNGNVVEFKPSVVEMNGDLYEGVTMCINSIESMTQMPIDRYEALYDIIKHFNLYLAGMALINYLARPEFETNTHTMNDTFFTKQSSFVETKGFLNNKIDNNIKGFFK